MRILHFLYDHVDNPWVGGGGAIRAIKIYEKLKEKGHFITIVSGSYPDSKDYSGDNLEVRFVGNSSNYFLSTFSYALAARSYCMQHFEDYDIIVEDFAPWNPLFTYRLQNRIPVVLQIHHREGMNIINKYFLAGIPFFLLEKIYPKRFSNIIAVSSITAEKFKVPHAQIISNGIDKGLLDITSSSGNYIAFIGRIDFYNKGLDTLLQADLNMPLHIAGKGRDEKKLIGSLGGHYIYLGYLTDREKKDIIKNSRFLIMPSRYEGQGIVALEAAALGKPVLVSDIPELSYVVENGFGISFQCDNSADLREKAEYLWNNHAILYQMGEKGRAYAENFTWDSVASEFEKYLLKVGNRS